MKNFIQILFLSLGLISCSSDNETINNQYEFILEYSATVTVGGVIGITERTFNIGETYTSTNEDDNTITIRIAEHSKLNEDCPNSWCYQELLVVPREFLKSTK